MFVLEALLLTFCTTPVVVMLYPPKYRKRAVLVGHNGVGDHEEPQKDAIGQFRSISRPMVILDKLEHLPSIITMIQLFRPFILQISERDAADLVQSSSGLEHGRTFPPTPTTSSSTVQALRLIELSERTSAVMKSSIVDSLIYTDPLLNLFKTFCDMSDIPVSPSLSVVSFDNLATTVIDHARENLSHIVLVPWLPSHVLNTHRPDYAHGAHLASHDQVEEAKSAKSTDTHLNPGIVTKPSSGPHSQFVRSIFTQSSVNAALFMALDGEHTKFGHYTHRRVVLPFFGGPDDRLALRMVVQMCGSPDTTAIVLRVTGHSGIAEGPSVPEINYTPINGGRGKPAVEDVQYSGHGTNIVGNGYQVLRHILIPSANPAGVL